jgi:hypothetical protein
LSGEKSISHAPPLHVPAIALSGAQTSPQAPQWSTLVFVFVSQPSEARELQSPVPVAQESSQRPSALQRIEAESPIGGGAQSLAFMQTPPISQGSHGPAQSTSASPWFFTRSEQLGAWQLPPLHTPLTQSVGSSHFFSSAQGPQRVPPQSTSVSPLFFTPSVHVASWHRPSMQLSFTQSLRDSQERPSAQGSQSMPPQSVSVSSASFVRLPQ